MTPNVERPVPPALRGAVGVLRPGGQGQLLAGDHPVLGQCPVTPHPLADGVVSRETRAPVPVVRPRRADLGHIHVRMRWRGASAVRRPLGGARQAADLYVPPIAMALTKASTSAAVVSKAVIHLTTSSCSLQT